MYKGRPASLDYRIGERLPIKISRYPKAHACPKVVEK